jgi:hypothetical protein
MKKAFIDAASVADYDQKSNDAGRLTEFSQSRVT